ncbi:hypothetical protein XarbCFBP8150_21370, partial [Xanthomonas arboricola]
IAEARQPELDAYLGLHYPATDIPAQARMQGGFDRRGPIADIGDLADAVAQVQRARLGTPVDLSDVSLRSVSPVHLEYLAN